jgi:hypothetical protein
MKDGMICTQCIFWHEILVVDGRRKGKCRLVLRPEALYRFVPGKGDIKVTDEWPKTDGADWCDDFGRLAS